MNKSPAGTENGFPQPPTAGNPGPNNLDERTQAADVDALFSPNTANPSLRFDAEHSRPPTGENSQHSVSQHPSSPPSGSSWSQHPSGNSWSQHPSGSTNQNTQNVAPGTLPAVGTRIQHYELIRQLGSGGMGTVFLARDTRLGRRVAIKFLHSDNPEVTKRFILEARATARCSHENIVIIYEVGEHNGSPFMVLEYLQGHPLNKLISGQRVPAARAVEIMVPVVRALATAHELGIVHRDLKPDNIVVTDSGSIKVLDFGIAKVLQDPEHPPEQESELSASALAAQASAAGGTSGEDLSNLTRRGAIMGTMPYMSPEQWRGGNKVDHRTDIWAVGIMLFRMITGKHPLDPLRGPQLVVTAHLNEPMPRLRDMMPDVPAALADVVDRCLLKHKDQRWPDAVSLLKALEPFLPGRFTRELRVDESPYAGLSSFQENDADRFFGRSKEIAALVHRIQSQPLVAVVGPSGAGKSSFVRAGLVPVLKRSGVAWESIVIRPGRHPLAALASIVGPLVNSSTTIEQDIQAQQKLIDRLHAEPGYVGSVLRSRARREKRRILLFIDQFEELYTLVPDAKERRAFTACLSGIADDATAPMRVVLSIRSDFLDRVPEDERFMAELNSGLFFLNTPGREGLRDALVQPAEMAGYQFESPAIVDDMLQHLESTQGALPLLQFAATQLWEGRNATHKLLTVDRYNAMGGIAGALATHADSVLNELPSQAGPLARQVLLRLVTPERTRAIVSMDELRELTKDGNEIQLLIDYLVQARLLVVQTAGGSTGALVEIVHESLIHSWPTLRRWLDEGQEDAAFMEQLRNAARQWTANGQDSDLLWRGEVVEEAQRFQRRYRGELPQQQRAFLDAVFAQAQKATRRRRALLLGSTVFLVGLVAASAVALVVIRNAQREAERQAVVAKVSANQARGAEAVARKAEAQAKQRLAEVQAKELERQRAQQEAETANAQVAITNSELQGKNEELMLALRRAKFAQWRAKNEKKNAEQNATTARQAQQDAIRAAKQLQDLLSREQERVQRLQSQLGSPIIDDLK
ncbi:protein kinase domain-containing protein [Hyalangium rubrum]|uniref:mitogen-activated protein kinase kinase n=1 Tax=Hyalangium rubrum TaxID=3103134 RepID=A0ABU5H3C2_9BACT|nr:protein kinase [Hyalangium sp. s54d21]MDY7227293.1 protein kinase [Hyalangium sp. s54d21]